MKSLMRQCERLWARSVVHNYLIGGRSKRKIADDRMALPAVNSVEGGNFRLAQIAAMSGRRPVVKGRFEGTVNVSGAVMSSAF